MAAPIHVQGRNISDDIMVRIEGENGLIFMALWDSVLYCEAEEK
jgi:hypothetical protein